MTRSMRLPHSTPREQPHRETGTCRTLGCEPVAGEPGPELGVLLRERYGPEARA